MPKNKQRAVIKQKGKIKINHHQYNPLPPLIATSQELADKYERSNYAKQVCHN